MDMSDIGRTPGAQSATPVDDKAPTSARWAELVAQIGVEIAGPLTAALERINLLTSTGNIDRKGLRALREEVESARRVGMIGQQLTRFASGRIRQSHERLQLADVLGGVLAHRGRETQARGIVLKPELKPAEVVVDASLLFSLLNSTLDWALASAHSQIVFSIEIKAWPTNARLACRFAHRPLDEASDVTGATTPAGLDSLTWRLLEQTAWTMGLIVERAEESNFTTLVLEFPRTATDEVEPVSASLARVERNERFGYLRTTDAQFIWREEGFDAPTSP